MSRRHVWLLVACLSCIPMKAGAQQAVTTTTRLNLRESPKRSSAIKRVLPAHAQLLWSKETADDQSMLKVVPVNAPADSGWVAGEFIVESSLSAGAHHHAAAACGVLRWPVKTMSDQDAGSVNRTPKGATIASLRALIAPKTRPQDARANAAEKTEYAVSGEVIDWGLEADGDFHLVLADKAHPTQTIVLEVPDPSCISGTIAAVHDSIVQARQDVIQALGSPPSGVTALQTPRPLTVTGVGFFDFGHSTGHPPNAFELHPVLTVHF